MPLKLFKKAQIKNRMDLPPPEIGWLALPETTIKVNFQQCISSTAKRRIAVIFFYPLLEEKINAYPYFSYFCNLLAVNGVDSFRFDYPGTSESIPLNSRFDFQLAKISSYQFSQYIKNHLGFDFIGSVTIRGGSLISTGVDFPFDFSVYWEPIINLKSFRRDLFRANILQQQGLFGEIRHNSQNLSEIVDNGGTFNIEGHEIDEAFLGWVDAFSFDTLHEKQHPTLMIALQKNTKGTLDKFSDQIAKETLQTAYLPVAAPFWSTACGKYLDLPLNCMDFTIDWITGVCQ